MSSLTTEHVGLASLHEPVRILQITDPHLFERAEDCLLGVNTQQTFVEVVEQALALDFAPDLVLVTGDIAQSPSAVCYQRCHAQISRFNAPQFWLQGNHDLNQLFESAQFRAHAGHRVIACGAWAILMLDSSVDHEVAGCFSEAELDWLARQLRLQQDRHVLVALHHHPLPVGSHWLDQHMLQNAPRFWDLLAGAPQVRLVMHGHVHQEVDCVHRQIRVLGCPSTSIQFAPHQHDFLLDAHRGPGFRWLKLHGDGRIETAVCRLDRVPTGQQQDAAGY